MKGLNKERIKKSPVNREVVIDQAGCLWQRWILGLSF